MIYRKLNSTDMNVSIIGLGGAPLGGLYESTNLIDCIDCVQAAIVSGINIIDTAPLYQKSEIVLGIALENIPRDKYYLCTKVGRYIDENGECYFDFSAQKTRESLLSSLNKLKQQYLDIVHVHDVEFCKDITIILQETLPVLLEYKKQGLIRYIGITGYPLDILEQLLTSCNYIDVCLSYCHYTLLDTSLHAFIQKFPNVGIINASPFAMGLLTENQLPVWHPASKDERKKSQQLIEKCASQGINISKVALKFSTSHPEIATTMVGMSTKTQVLKNVETIVNSLLSTEKLLLQNLQYIN
jgi:L-galactose dehydrogenase